MSNERDIEILQRRIAEINEKIIYFEKYNISEVKRDRLIEKRDRYQTKLDELQS